MEREKLGSRLGFILLSAGCAIGVGNVWRFPYITGENGGGIFVLVYFICLLVMGLPLMTMEFSLGRASQRSIAKMYDELAPAKSKWKLHGYAALGGNVILMMFYTVVTGWMINYFVFSLSGVLEKQTTPAAVDALYGGMMSDPWMMMLYTGIAIVVGFLVCSFSLQGGLERVTKYMMIALLVIMIVLAIYGFTQDGAKEGLAFYLVPDFSKLSWKTVVEAMNQAFFTLSIGIGSMAIFGSYLKKDRALLGESVNVVVLDTFVAIVSGLIIFPACFTYSAKPAAGPGLVFQTLPNIFNNMPGGRVWGTLFFLFMTFASLSTVFAVFENIVSCIRDLTGWGRKKTCLIGCFAMFVLTLPCIFGFNLLSNIAPFGEGSVIMDLEDFIVSNCLLPIGSLVILLFCVSKRAWGWDNFIAEANTGKGLKMKKWMRGYITYVLPVIIVALFIIGVVTKFVPMG